MPGRSPGQPLPRPRESNEGRKVHTMTRTKRANAARKRGELSRDGVGRRLSPAIDARRRLNVQRNGPAGTSAGRLGPRDHRFGPRDPRYDYLTRPHD
jgi:hypothetical protein